MSNRIPSLTDLKKKRCLVLGGSGFIGQNLCLSLRDKAGSVKAFSRHRVCIDGVEWVEGSFSQNEDVRQAAKDVDVVYHLISTTMPAISNTRIEADARENILASIHMLDACRDAGVERIVFVSSGGTVYGESQQFPTPEDHPTNPICAYGISKLAIEKYLGLYKQLYGLDYTVLRIANPYGERQRTHASQGAVAVFLAKVLRGEPIEIWGDGSVVRDYIYIADVVDALLAVLDRTGNDHVFNIGSGRGLSLNEVLDYIETVTGRTAVRRYMPSRTFDVPRNVLSIERAKHSIGWSPKVDFEQGISRFAEWLLQHPNVD